MYILVHGYRFISNQEAHGSTNLFENLFNKGIYNDIYSHQTIIALFLHHPWILSLTSVQIYVYFHKNAHHAHVLEIQIDENRS